VLSPAGGTPDGAAEGNDEAEGNDDEDDNEGVEMLGMDLAATGSVVEISEALPAADDSGVENVGVENVIEASGVVDVGDAVVDGESVDVEPMLPGVVPIVEGIVGV
jgi:hypothetical protein